MNTVKLLKIKEMNRMNTRFVKYFKAILFAGMAACMFTSCLKSGLEDLPSFDESKITDVKFEFRYKDVNDLWIDGEPIVKFVNLTVQNKVINAETGNISCTVRVPAASGAFTETIRGQVSLTSIVGKFNISTAAVIEPVEGSPTLGIPGDFSAPRKYRVTAANGTSQVWTIHITGMDK